MSECSWLGDEGFLFGMTTSINSWNTIAEKPLALMKAYFYLLVHSFGKDMEKNLIDVGNLNADSNRHFISVWIEIVWLG